LFYCHRITFTVFLYRHKKPYIYYTVWCIIICDVDHRMLRYVFELRFSGLFQVSCLLCVIMQFFA